MFKFDLFFLVKGLRSRVWQTRDITIGGRNPTDINFASIGNQIQFLDTIKYFQQSLAGLASSLTDEEKRAIYRECEKYLLSDPVLSKRFRLCTKDEKKWVLDYLSSGKGTIPYDLITELDSLNIVPEKEFFSPHHFYSSMKDSTISDEEYENVKKFYTTLKWRNLGELNHEYNFQDTLIICETFEQRSSRLQEFLNITLASAIPQVALVVVSIETKVSVVLLFQLTLNVSEYSRKH